MSKESQNQPTNILKEVIQESRPDLSDEQQDALKFMIEKIMTLPFLDDELFQDFVNTFRTDNRIIEHPTSQESILQLFNNSSIVSLEELKESLGITSDAPSNHVTSIIGRVNRKLENHNLRIERCTDYKLTSFDSE